MFSKVKSMLFKENPQTSQKSHHSQFLKGDASQCPFIAAKTKRQGGCPSKQSNQKKQEKKQKDCSDSEEQQPKGGCPFMNTSQKKKNPGLQITHEGYDQPFVSKYKYYLSPNKMDFAFLKKNYKNIGKNRQIFNTYPIYLQHTLFYQGQDFKKVRKMECCSRFLAYQEMREKGNKYFNKGKFYKALDYYQRAISLFKWLEYSEIPQKPAQEQKSFSLSNIPSQQSIGMNSQINQSKLKLNINSQASYQDLFPQKNQQFDQLRQKYKQFFVVYNDSNVVLFDGEDLEEEADIDMRKSLMIQVYINMAATYMNLNHYCLAEQVIDDAIKLADRVSQAYLRKSQALLLKQNCTLSEAQQAKKLITKAINMKSNEKIFANTNNNILKMLNIHDADQVYKKCLQRSQQTIQIKQRQQKQIKQKIYQRSKRIHQIQQNMILQGKNPQQNLTRQTLKNTSQYRILDRMKDKYIKVIDFYTQARNQQQINLAKKQFQQILKICYSTENIYNIKIQENDNQLGGITTPKIQKRIQNIKTQYANDIYNTGKFNFTVLEWAIKEIVKQQKQQRELKQKQAEKSVNKNQQSEIPTKSSFGNLIYILVLIPIIMMLVNYFLL